MNIIETILYAVLIILILVVLALIAVFIIIRKKEKGGTQEKIEIGDIEEINPKATKQQEIQTYDRKSIFDFMEFESVQDNMIVQKDGKRFIMAIECKGINYDLMSEVEKTSTEQGFANFLNTLKDPIQIYIQTRTINLEKNIEDYQERVDKIKESIGLKEYRLREYSMRPGVNKELLKDKNLELLREKNLYSYGQDVVADAKKMSLNKNVLKKKYYIILRYFYESVDAGNEVESSYDNGTLKPEEIREVAFSNLYTKAMAMIRVLGGIGVVGRTLDSYELVELLYNAYNRDDSEIFGIDKALEAGYNEIYIDAQNVVDKKIAALNKEIQIRSQQLAKDAVENAADERSQELKDIEENIDTIIANLARQIIEEEAENVAEDVRERAVKKVERKKKQKKGEGEANDKQNTKESNGKRKAS